MNLNRLGVSLALGLTLLIAIVNVAAGNELLDPATQPRFVNPLPIPARMDLTGGGNLVISMTQFQQHLGLYDPHTHQPLMTTVWGYHGTFPGPTLVARRDVPLNILWSNDLVDNNGPLPHILPVDVTLHWADPAGWPGTGVPTVTHLHGGHTESASDGLPEAWFTPGFGMTGNYFVKPQYHYDNDQEAATLWYHDHALGITRLNVYAGLAGFYLLRDDNEDALVAANQLPTGPYEIEIVVQDRMFTEDGELYYPSEPEEEGQPEPSVLPEFFGDIILVNGAAWPILDVEPRQYRFRFLNGSDSRFYNMWPVDHGLQTATAISLRAASHVPAIYQIGSDDGLLESPVRLNKILIGPGERIDVVMDFSNPAVFGKTFVMKNNARSPFPKGDVIDPSTAGQIMAFRIGKPLDTSQYPLTTLPQNLRPLHGPIDPLVQDGAARSLILFEGEDEYGRLEPQLGTVEDGALKWAAPITENPMVDDVEVWAVYNGTEDAHPIHLHLVAFQILDRQKFRADQNPENGALSNIKLIGKAKAPGDGEQGWKDTAIMYPGEVTRVIAKFDREGRYVWHCHILSHEDHEMMRPYYVGPMANGEAQVAKGGATLERSPEPIVLEQNHPNPFNPVTEIRFRLPEAAPVEVTVYDVAGREVRRLANRLFDSGPQSVRWDGKDNEGNAVSSGVYFYRLRSDRVAQVRKMVMIR